MKPACRRLAYHLNIAPPARIRQARATRTFMKDDFMGVKPPQWVLSSFPLVPLVHAPLEVVRYKNMLCSASRFQLFLPLIIKSLRLIASRDALAAAT